MANVRNIASAAAFLWDLQCVISKTNPEDYTKGQLILAVNGKTFAKITVRYGTWEDDDEYNIYLSNLIFSELLNEEREQIWTAATMQLHDFFLAKGCDFVSYDLDEWELSPFAGYDEDGTAGQRWVVILDRFQEAENARKERERRA